MPAEEDRELEGGRLCDLPLEPERAYLAAPPCEDRCDTKLIEKERGNERGSVLPLQTVSLNSARRKVCNAHPS